VPPDHGVFDRVPSLRRSLWRPLSRPLRAASAFQPSPPGEAARPASTAVSSKTTASSEPRRLPSTSALSPVRRLAPPSGIVENPPPFPRLCRREPASDALLQPEHEAGELDPTPSTLVAQRGDRLGPDASRRLLQPEQSTSTTARPPDPRLMPADGSRPARAGLGGKTSGWG